MYFCFLLVHHQALMIRQDTMTLLRLEEAAESMLPTPPEAARLLQPQGGAPALTKAKAAHRRTTDMADVLRHLKKEDYYEDQLIFEHVIAPKTPDFGSLLSMSLCMSLALLKCYGKRVAGLALARARADDAASVWD